MGSEFDARIISDYSQTGPTLASQKNPMIKGRTNVCNYVKIAQGSKVDYQRRPVINSLTGFQFTIALITFFSNTSYFKYSGTRH